MSTQTIAPPDAPHNDTCLIEGILLLGFVLGMVLGIWAQLRYITP